MLNMEYQSVFWTLNQLAYTDELFSRRIPVFVWPSFNATEAALMVWYVINHEYLHMITNLLTIFL